MSSHQHRRQLIVPDLGRFVLPTLLVVACSSSAGDEGESSGETSGSQEYIDEDAAVSRALDFASWDRINAEARASQHALGDTVNMWVPPEYAALYRAIDPELVSIDDVFPEGAMVVKEHLSAEGETQSFTLLVKAAPGYDPERADWWWGRIALDGTIEDGGKVGFCIDCHTPRASTDWVFGVPLDNRN